MDKELLILVLGGTTREKRKSMAITDFIAEIGNDIEGVRTEIVDPKDLNLPGDGNDPEAKDPRYSKLTKEADGLFIVVPEYNHSFPGSLKRMLDSELENYIHKPAALAGVSAGMWGGTRGVESLIPALREMGLVATFTDVYFQGSYDLFDDKGQMKDDNKERYTKAVKKSYDELIWMAQTLKKGRES